MKNEEKERETASEQASEREAAYNKVKDSNDAQLGEMALSR